MTLSYNCILKSQTLFKVETKEIVEKLHRPDFWYPYIIKLSYVITGYAKVIVGESSVFTISNDGQIRLLPYKSYWLNLGDYKIVIIKSNHEILELERENVENDLNT